MEVLILTLQLNKHQLNYPDDYVIGILVSRTKLNFESKSRFILSSPSQGIGENKGTALFAMYLPEPDMNIPQKILIIVQISLKIVLNKHTHTKPVKKGENKVSKITGY